MQVQCKCRIFAKILCLYMYFFASPLASLVPPFIKLPSALAKNTVIPKKCLLYKVPLWDIMNEERILIINFARKQPYRTSAGNHYSFIWFIRRCLSDCFTYFKYYEKIPNTSSAGFLINFLAKQSIDSSRQHSLLPTPATVELAPACLDSSQQKEPR